MDITAIGAFSVNSRHGSGGTSQHPAQRRNVGTTAAPSPPRRGERAEADDVDKPLRSPHGGA